MDRILLFAPLLAQQRIQSIDLDLGVLKFRSQASSVSNQTLAAIVVAVVLIGVIVAVALYYHRRRRMLELNQQREEARLRLMMSELNLGQSEVDLIKIIVDSENPGDVIPILELRSEFEEALLRFREGHADHPALHRVSQLRQRLEYGFSNIRNPFVDTRMLAPGTRLRCKIRLASRDVNFLTTVLAINESQFIIRPPVAKGNPVSLGRLERLHFRVARENDAEYEFTSSLIGQLPNATKAVVLEHSQAINRMLFRNAERIETHLPIRLYVIRQEYTGDRSIAHMKALDSQYMFEGTIVDLSIGGALVSVDKGHERLHEGDMIVFQLPDAHIKDDIVAQVVGIFPSDEGNTQIHLQLTGLKELNRLKLSKYLTMLKDNPPAGEAGSEELRPHAS